MKKYYLYTFIISWVIMIAASLMASKLDRSILQLILMGVMLMPTLGVILSGHSLKDIAFRPVFKGKIKYWLMAWFLPMVITVLGALIYFGLFPDRFDLSGAVMEVSAGTGILKQMAAQRITYPMYILICIVQSLTIAPLLNLIPSLGEEIGWRGLMTPYLTDRYGRTRGLLIAGTVWGIWHWPLIALMGYEYGTAYFGAPLSGMLLFCIVTVALGILLAYVCEKTSSVIAPALMHGSFNAWGTIPVAVIAPQYASDMLLGPSPNGLLAGIPLFVIAVIVLRKWR